MPGRAGAADPEGTGSYTAPAGTAGAVIDGRYKLLQKIGEGGMGEVWMADQTAPVRRRVALKLVRAERGTSKAVLTRFEAERQAIALMDHPNVAKLFDAGTTAEGSPFFVMELVRGIPLTQFCDQHRLTVPDRLRLFVSVCQAVQHAHQKGIIHRDLKPSNILVESHGGRPVPKVIDFGLAKATTGMQLTDHTLFTGFGAVLGTPLYMAPEQATFDAVDVDTRADIYALGVILYELLTGTTPLARETVKKAALDQVLKLIREQEPPTPSSRLSGASMAPGVAASRQTEPARLGRFVRGELDWIVLKALAKERDRRYDTADGFAKDIERFLNHEPVQAGPPTAGYRLRKFVQRNRGRVIAAGVVAAALLCGLAGTTVGLVEAKRQADRAERAADEEREQRRLVEEKKGELLAKQVELESEQARLKEQTKAAVDARRDADLELHDNQRVLLRQAWEAGDAPRMKAVLNQMRPKPGRPDLRGFESHYLDRLAHAETDRVAGELPPGDSSNLMDWWTPGRVYYRGSLAANKHYLTFTATDLSTGRPLAGFSPILVKTESAQVFPAGMVVPGELPRLWTWGQLPSIEPAVMADNNAFQTGMPVNNVMVWDGLTGRALTGCARLLPDPELVKQGWRHRFLWTPLADSSNPAGTATVTQLIRDVKDPDGKLAGVEARAQLHDLATGKAIRVLDPRPGSIRWARFSFDGRHVVTRHTKTVSPGKEAHRLAVWDAGTGVLAWEKEIESGWTGDFTRDGRAVVLMSTPGNADAKPHVAHAFAVATGQPVVPLPAATDAVAWPMQASAGVVVKAAQDKYEVRDARTDVLLDVLPAAGGPVPPGGVRHWLGEGGELVIPWQANGQLSGVVSKYRPPRGEVILLPEGTSLGRREASGEYVSAVLENPWVDRPGDTLVVTTFDPATRKAARLELRSSRFSHRLSTSVGRSLVVVAVHIEQLLPDSTGEKPRYKVGGRLLVFDQATGQERFTATLAEGMREGFGDFRIPFALSPDEARIVTRDPHTQLHQCLDARTGKEVWAVPLPKGVKWTGEPLFAAGGSRVAVFGVGAVCAFDASDGRLVKRLAEGPADETGLVPTQGGKGVTPDGRTLHYANRGTLTLIDTADWAVRHRISPLASAPPVADPLAARWQSVGDRFATFVRGQRWEVWDVHTGSRVSQFEQPRASGPASQVELSADATRAFVLTRADLRVVDLSRGREVLALPLGGWVLVEARLDLSGDGRELTVTAVTNGRTAVLRRVFDARPLTAEELTRGARLEAVRPPSPKPGRPGNAAAPAGPPATASDHFDWAVWHESRQQWKEAVESYRAAIKLDPDFAPLHRKLAELLHLRANDPGGAIAAYREAVRLAPDDFASWLRLGLLLESRGEHRRAVAAIREAVAASDRSTVPVGNWAPSRLMLLNALGYNLRESGELAEAEKVLWTALKLLDGEKAFAEAVGGVPSPATVVTNLAVCLIRQGKAKEGEAECEALVKRMAALIPKEDTSKPPPGDFSAHDPTRRLAEALTSIGEAFLWADRWEEAVAWSDRAIAAWAEYRKRWPPPPGETQSRPPHWVKAVALNWLGKGKEAVAAIDESIKLAPPAEKLYQRMMRARYVAQTGDHAEAVRQVKAVQAEPNPNPNCWDAALAYSLCVRAAKGNPKLQEEYAKEAVTLLRKALDAKQYGYPWRKDADLDPIRDRDDFKQLLADLDKATAPKPEK